MSSRLHVTDHAVVRYLERVMGVDVKAIRRQIAKNARLAEEHDCSAVNSGGFHYVMQGTSIVTVTPQNEPNKRTGRK